MSNENLYIMQGPNSLPILWSKIPCTIMVQGTSDRPRMILVIRQALIMVAPLNPDMYLGSPMGGSPM